MFTKDIIHPLPPSGRGSEDKAENTSSVLRSGAASATVRWCLISVAANRWANLCRCYVSTDSEGDMLCVGCSNRWHTSVCPGGEELFSLKLQPEEDAQHCTGNAPRSSFCSLLQWEIKNLFTLNPVALKYLCISRGCEALGQIIQLMWHQLVMWHF